jgi:septal ring factor EnvC (AmiA/AmiB activator)
MAFVRHLVFVAGFGAWISMQALGADALAQTDGSTAKKNTPKRGAPKKSASIKREAKSSEVLRKDQLQAEQRDLKERLTKLKNQLAASEASHSEATDALRASEAAISSVNRRLRELASARTQLEQQIAGLQDRNRAIVARQSEQERQFGLVLRTQYVLARATPWQKFLDGENPGAIGRDLNYLDYIGRAKAQLIGELRARRVELAELEAESRVHQIELMAVAEEERENRAQLIQQLAARKQALDRVAKQIAAQRQSIATLERDERRLTSLIDQLAKVLAEQAQRRERAAAPAKSRSTSPAPVDAEPSASLAFTQLRGRLSLPVQGEVTARFGSPRRTEAGVDAPTWKGVFIRALPGTEVHAIAAGRVIFADWLRGFGNLLILDHGEGFISVYGNNSTLIRSVGEKVGRGDVISEIGNTGGHAEAGLYFELRYQGRAMDPLRWAAAR